MRLGFHQTDRDHVDLIWSENWSYYKHWRRKSSTERGPEKEKRRAVAPRGASSLEGW
jgi:hypothetical protein